MRKLRFILPLLLSTVLSACSLDDAHEDYPSLVAFGTVSLSDSVATGYYFTLDNKETVHAGDVSRVSGYAPADSTRTILYFKLLDQAVEGFNYNAIIYEVNNMEVNSIDHVANDQEMESYGSDRIHVESACISGGYLNIFYAIPTSGNPALKHRFSAIDNTSATPPAQMPEGYTMLEMRHDAAGDKSGRLTYNYICFKLDSSTQKAIGTNGIYLKSKSLSGATTYLKVDSVHPK